MEDYPTSISLTQKLLSFNTINPPGLERDCAEYLGQILEDGGFRVSLHEFATGRTSLIARLDGRKASLHYVSLAILILHRSAWPLGVKILLQGKSRETKFTEEGPLI
jgi:acetylornithine deacetylase/succinyl-diaminopimelate desuccinylase-like protein